MRLGGGSSGTCTTGYSKTWSRWRSGCVRRRRHPRQRQDPRRAIVYLVGGFVGATAPPPGGLGGVEAALAAGLTGIGTPANQAIPAVLIFRFATFWLPIPAG